jgi:hypothetical protein
MAETEDELTPSQLLMSVLEAFGEDEPEEVMIVWQSKKTIHLQHAGDYVKVLGLLSFAHAKTIRRLLGDEHEN